MAHSIVAERALESSGGTCNLSSSEVKEGKVHYM